MNKETEKQPQQTTFLVAYDYGQGGVWGYVTAASAEAITAQFPDLEVVDETPEWLTEDIQARLPQGNLSDPENPFLSIFRNPQS